MADAKTVMEREKMNRMDIIRIAVEGECVANCNGEWFTCAMEVLRNNQLHPYLYAASLRELLEKGRGKFGNIMICGPAKCAKSFMLRPLQNVFEAFSNPAKK